MCAEAVKYVGLAASGNGSGMLIYFHVILIELCFSLDFRSYNQHLLHTSKMIQKQAFSIL